jgi:acetyl-CoA acetyltransferase
MIPRDAGRLHHRRSPDPDRTPRGALADIRPDDLAAATLRALVERPPNLDPEQVDSVSLGDTNQAGEDNRNVARMALL